MFTPEEINALVGPIRSDDDWKAAVAKFEADVALARSAMDELDDGVTTVVLPDRSKPVEWVAPTGSMTVRWLTRSVMESLMNGWKATTARKEALEQVRPKGTKEVWSETAYTDYWHTDALLRTLYYDQREFYAAMETKRRAVFRRRQAPFRPAFFDSVRGFFLGQSFPSMFPKPSPDIEKALENVRFESSKLHRTARSSGNTDYTRDEAARSIQAFEYWEDLERQHLGTGHILRIDKVKLGTVRLLWEYYCYPILRRRLRQLVRARETQSQQKQQQQQQQSQEALLEPPPPLSQPQQQQQQHQVLSEQTLPQQQQHQQQQQQQVLPEDVDSPMEVDSASFNVETGETLEEGEISEPVETLETGAERLEGARSPTPLTSLEPTMLEIELRESERRDEEDLAAQLVEISRMSAEVETNIRQRNGAGTRRVRGGRQVVDLDEETPVIQESPESPPPGHRGEDSIIMSQGDGEMDFGDVGMETIEPFEVDASPEEIQAPITASNNNNSNSSNNNSSTAAVPCGTVETRAKRVSSARRASPQPEAGPSRIPANGGGSGVDVDDDDDDEHLGDGCVRHRVLCDQCRKRDRDCMGLPQRTCAPCLKQAKGCSLATKGRAVAAKRKAAREARDREEKRRKVTALAASSVGGHVEHDVLQREVGESELQFVLARMDHRDKVLSRMLNEISVLIAQVHADRRLLLELAGVKTGEGENEEEEEEEGGEEERVQQLKGKGRARR
ncbi:hypothetical protein ACEPAI_3190 [Sanghuangporus weigelae]